MEKLLFVCLSALTLTFCGPGNTVNLNEIVITPGLGVTGVNIGDNVQDAMDAYGKVSNRYVNVGSSSQYRHFLLYLDEGLNFFIEPYSSKNLDQTKPVISINISSPSKAKTAEGIGIGSTLLEVKTAYGEPADSSILGHTYDGMTIEYDSEGLVESISIH